MLTIQIFIKNMPKNTDDYQQAKKDIRMNLGYKQVIKRISTVGVCTF